MPAVIRSTCNSAPTPGRQDRSEAVGGDLRLSIGQLQGKNLQFSTAEFPTGRPPEISTPEPAAAATRWNS